MQFRSSQFLKFKTRLSLSIMQIFKKILFSLFLLMGVGLFSACTELLNDSDTAPDGSAPAIQLQAPAENSLFNRGNIIPIKSVISDKDRIKEMEVQVIKISQGVASPVIWGYKKFPKTNPVIVDT